MGIGLKASTGAEFRACQGVDDLKLVRRSGQPSRIFRGGNDVRWQARFRAGDGVRTVAHLSPVGCEVSRRFQRPQFQLSRSVPVHGLRPAYVPREPARHRSLPERTAGQALSPGYSWQCQSQCACRRQRRTRLAHLLRFRPSIDLHRPAPVYQRAARRGTERDGLRAGLDHHRPLSVAVSLGPVSPDQGRGETAHAARPAGGHSHLHPYQRRQAPRRQRLGSARSRTGRLLRDGSRVPGLRTTLQDASGRQLLRHAGEVQFQVQTLGLPARGSQHRVDLRSVGGVDYGLLASGLPRAAASHSLQGSRNRKDAGLSDQQLRLARAHHRRPLQKPVASGTVLSLDQAASARQRFFGTSENAVKSQVWIAVAVYVLVAAMDECELCDTELVCQIPLYHLLSLSLPSELEVGSSVDAALARGAAAFGAGAGAGVAAI